MVLIAALALVSPLIQKDKPILVRSSSAGPIKGSDGGWIPAYDMESVWRSKSGKTLCLIAFSTAMEHTDVYLKFKSKLPSGKWVETKYQGSNSIDMRFYYDKLLLLSDTKAVVSTHGPEPATFRKAINGKWHRKS